MSELLQKAKTSFGIQAHSTLEPGVVIIAAKGQTMSVSFRQDTPMVLFASESLAVEVMIKPGDLSLAMNRKISLDNDGEVMRIGKPCDLVDGRYTTRNIRRSESMDAFDSAKVMEWESQYAIYVCPDLTIRAYSTKWAVERSEMELRARVINITALSNHYHLARLSSRSLNKQDRSLDNLRRVSSRTIHVSDDEEAAIASVAIEEVQLESKLASVAVNHFPPRRDMVAEDIADIPFILDKVRARQPGFGPGLARLTNFSSHLYLPPFLYHCIR